MKKPIFIIAEASIIQLQPTDIIRVSREGGPGLWLYRDGDEFLLYESDNASHCTHCLVKIWQDIKEGETFIEI